MGGWLLNLLRFGPDAMTWKGCATHREYIKHGLLASSGFYIGTIGFLILWSIFGVGSTGAYVCFIPSVLLYLYIEFT